MYQYYGLLPGVYATSGVWGSGIGDSSGKEEYKMINIRAEGCCTVMYAFEYYGPGLLV